MLGSIRDNGIGAEADLENRGRKVQSYEARRQAEKQRKKEVPRCSRLGMTNQKKGAAHLK